MGSAITKVNEKLKTDLGSRNILALPKVVKVVINVGIGQAKTNPKFAEAVITTLMAITGQKPAVRISRKAISGFKIREGEKVGMMVTLRGKKMHDFIIKLANIVLPRMRDFRGLKIVGFGKSGNFTLGISEQIIFPEISHEKAEIIHGMSISIKTTAKNPLEGQKLLEAWGLPFEKPPSTTLPRADSGQVRISQDKASKKDKLNG